MEQLINLNVTEVITHIETLCQARKSGTVFLLTEKNKFAQVIILSGAIINARYLRQRGMSALETIFQSNRFNQFSYREKTASAIGSQQDSQFPTQSKVLTFIKETAEAKISKGGPQRNVSKSISPARISRLVAPELAVYLGPIATIICDGYLENAKTPAGVMRAIDSIASEIDNLTDATTFSRMAKAKIKNFL
ncbi:MAG: hypothetical protein ACPG8W_25220 [Candidatus Promineifilaceae bacterium]